MKKTIAIVACGMVVGCAAVSLIAHRRVIAAMVKGEPLPEAPAWHKFHPMLKCKQA